MATGVGGNTETGWVNAPTDLPGFGGYQWEQMAGRDYSRAMVGGPIQDPSGVNADTGFNRIATGESSPNVPGPGGAKTTDWRFLLNWQHNPMFWVLLFALAAVGFIHARLSLRAGPGHAHIGLG